MKDVLNACFAPAGTVSYFQLRAPNYKLYFDPASGFFLEKYRRLNGPARRKESDGCYENIPVTYRHLKRRCFKNNDGQ
jgi:hypothetical protein